MSEDDITKERIFGRYAAMDTAWSSKQYPGRYYAPNYRWVSDAGSSEVVVDRAKDEANYASEARSFTEMAQWNHIDDIARPYTNRLYVSLRCTVQSRALLKHFLANATPEDAEREAVQTVFQRCVDTWDRQPDGSWLLSEDRVLWESPYYTRMASDKDALGRPAKEVDWGPYKEIVSKTPADLRADYQLKYDAMDESREMSTPPGFRYPNWDETLTGGTKLTRDQAEARFNRGRPKVSNPTFKTTIDDITRVDPTTTTVKVTRDVEFDLPGTSMHFTAKQGLTDTWVIEKDGKDFFILHTVDNSDAPLITDYGL
jgi:hypothetical protein